MAWKLHIRDAAQFRVGVFNNSMYLLRFFIALLAVSLLFMGILSCGLSALDKGDEPPIQIGNDEDADPETVTESDEDDQLVPTIPSDSVVSFLGQAQQVRAVKSDSYHAVFSIDRLLPTLPLESDSYLVDMNDPGFADIILK